MHKAPHHAKSDSDFAGVCLVAASVDQMVTPLCRSSLTCGSGCWSLAGPRGGFGSTMRHCSDSPPDRSQWTRTTYLTALYTSATRPSRQAQVGSLDVCLARQLLDFNRTQRGLNRLSLGLPGGESSGFGQLTWSTARYCEHVGPAAARQWVDRTAPAMGRIAAQTVLSSDALSRPEEGQVRPPPSRSPCTARV